MTTEKGQGTIEALVVLPVFVLGLMAIVFLVQVGAIQISLKVATQEYLVCQELLSHSASCQQKVRQDFQKYLNQWRIETRELTFQHQVHALRGQLTGRLWMFEMTWSTFERRPYAIK